MAVAKIVLAGVAALTIISSGAWAQEHQQTGRIVKIDQANGKITLQHNLVGTVGAAGAASPTDEYKIQDGLAVRDFKVGDQVDFTETRVGDVWTVTKIQKK